MKVPVLSQEASAPPLCKLYVPDGFPLRLHSLFVCLYILHQTVTAGTANSPILGSSFSVRFLVGLW